MTQHQGRVHLCLLWTFVLTSITIQLLFITYYFTGLHRQPVKKPAGKMVTAKATSVESGKIKWKLQNTENLPLSLEDGDMTVTIKEDGYYFLFLQVTTKKKGKVHTVHVKKNIGNAVSAFLEGEITNSSLSTCFLGRVAQLSANTKLVVTIEPAAEISVNSGSRLGVIYLPEDHS